MFLENPVLLEAYAIKDQFFESLLIKEGILTYWTKLIKDIKRAIT